MADPGRLLNRQELLRAIWGDSAYRDPRAIDVHIRHLREKLEPEPEKPRYILTVRGAGYRLRGLCPAQCGTRAASSAATQHRAAGRLSSPPVRRRPRSSRSDRGRRVRNRGRHAGGRGADAARAARARLRDTPTRTRCVNEPQEATRSPSFAEAPVDCPSRPPARPKDAARRRQPDAADASLGGARQRRDRRLGRWQSPGPDGQGEVRPATRTCRGSRPAQRRRHVRRRGRRVQDASVPKFTLRHDRRGRVRARGAAVRWPGTISRTVLVVRKPIVEIPSAVTPCARRSCTPPWPGSRLTLILGIPLSAHDRPAPAPAARGRAPARRRGSRRRRGPRRPRPATRSATWPARFDQMQQRLQQQEEARRAFVSTASHELRTPLASLDGMLELLDDDLRSGDPDLADARSLLERARTQSRRLARLAADLLDLSRLDAQVQLRSEPVELGELSRAVLAEFELGTEERGIVSSLDDSVGQVWARGDPGCDRPDRPDPARQRGPRQPARAARSRSSSATATNVSLTRPRRGPRGAARGARADLRALPTRPSGQRARPGSASGWPSAGSWPSGWAASSCSSAPICAGATFTLRLPVARAQEEEPLAVL